MKIQFGRAMASHTLWRYFLSYFLVVCILLLCFVLIAYSLLSSAVSDRLHAQTEQRLDYVVERLEEELQAVFGLNKTLSENIDIILARYNDNSYAQLQASWPKD